jgi:hypothetical protein
MPLAVACGVGGPPSILLVGSKRVRLASVAAFASRSYSRVPRVPSHHGFSR